MGNYVKNNLNRNESIIMEAKRTWVFLIGTWIVGVLFCWLIFPLIMAIVKTVKYFSNELAITNKRVMGKVGSSSSQTLDAPLNKIQNCSTSSTLFGKIFKYGNIKIDTAAGTYVFIAIKNPDAFKSALMAQIDQYEEDKIKQQAEEMAKAMAGAIKK